MLRPVPFTWCEILLLKLLFAPDALSAFDAVLAHASIGAVVCQLSRSKTPCAHPSLTLGALPRGTFRLLQLDALFAVLA